MADKEGVPIENEQADPPYTAFNEMASTVYGELVKDLVDGSDGLLSFNPEVLTACFTRSVFMEQSFKTNF